jgi:hypothetical protein
MTRPFVRLILLACVGFLLSGCFHSREISQIKREVARHHPEASFDRQVVVQLGPLSLGIVGFATSFIPGEEAGVAHASLTSFSRIKFGVYNTSLTNVELSLPIIDRLRNTGWELVLRFQDEEQSVWLLTRERRRRLRDVYMIALTQDQLVVVKTEGDFERMIEGAFDYWSRRTKD